MENDIVGYTGTFFISTNLIPQIFHIYKIKNTDSISTIAIILGILSAGFMGTYGFLIKKLPIIISNVMIGVFYSIIMIMKITYQNNRIEKKELETNITIV
jgi:uncharacterized protein with PQ loop repeat